MVAGQGSPNHMMWCITVRGSQDYSIPKHEERIRGTASILLIHIIILVDFFHLDSAALSDDAHQTGPNISHVIVFAQESYVILDCLTSTGVPGRKASASIGPPCVQSPRPAKEACASKSWTEMTYFSLAAAWSSLVLVLSIWACKVAILASRCA